MTPEALQRCKELANTQYELTPALIDRVCEFIRRGNYTQVAAAANGISTSRFYEWLQKYEDFRDAIEKASGEAEDEALGLVRSGHPEKWAPNAWYLERKHPDRWGRRALVVADAEKRKLETEKLRAEIALIKAKSVEDVTQSHEVTVVIPDFAKTEPKAD